MPYPVPILSSWLLTGVVDHVPIQTAYCSVYLSKRFIEYIGEKCSLPWTPLIRILSFQSTTPSGEIILLIHDSTHAMVARFTREATQRFEQTFGQRITFETVNRLIVVRSASLKFVSDSEKADFARAFGSLRVRFHGAALVYLEVAEIEFYARDRIAVSFAADNALIPIYKDVEYLKRYRNGLHQVSEKNGGLDTDDKLVSDEEEICKAWRAEWCS